MDSVYDKKENCYGCNACFNICPTKAISTHEDEEGFLYPVIDNEKCTNCGLCKRTCPIYHHKDCQPDFNQKVYAVKHKTESTRLLSSSGGMFTAISDYILEKGGVIYGAGFEEGLKVCHQRASTKPKRNEMRGSKYVQSDIGSIFRMIKKDRKNGKWVLFVGTPCQCAGLQLFLQEEDCSKLILCDIVCHGVPSNRMWQEYRALIRRKKGVIKYHNFRTKINGWHSMTSRNVFINGKEDYKSILSQVHMNLFLTDLLLRPCCYQCRFCDFQRGSDITIADFWGVERSLPEFDDNKGISLVLINTQKGEELVNQVKDNLVIIESNLANCHQRNLEEPTPRPKNREEFWNDYQAHGYEYIAKKYGNDTIKARVSSMLHSNVKGVKKFFTIKNH